MTMGRIFSRLKLIFDRPCSRLLKGRVKHCLGCFLGIALWHCLAGVKASSFAIHHKELHDSIKGKLSGNHLGKMGRKLGGGFYQKFVELGDAGKVDLMEAVRTVMFSPAVRVLLGEESVSGNRADIAHFQKTFAKFDEDFEYGTELPHIFLGKWRKCKKFLVEKFTSVVDQLFCKGLPQSPPDRTVLQSLISFVDRENAPNYALLLLWASQANAIPGVFWTVAFILKHEEVYQKIVQEAFNVLGENFKLSKGEISEETVKKLSYTRKCILEAVRLRAPGAIVRKSVSSLQLQNYTVPAGHFVMLSPYWSHRNPDFFPNPETFDPNRWDKADLEKNLFLEGFVGFGGGRFQCPGRWFAIMEMQMVVATFFYLFQLEMVSPLPEPSPLHLVGIQQPQQPCFIKFQTRP
eukprot:m.41809 g.41809  ORF g.41809 m.41809 type:complete len:406 (+) comp33264_c0_seq3:262-1479(+)